MKFIAFAKSRKWKRIAKAEYEKLDKRRFLPCRMQMIPGSPPIFDLDVHGLPPHEVLAGLKFALLGQAAEISIAELELSKRARDCMERLDIRTVGDLVIRTGRDLLKCPNVHLGTLEEVRERLAAKGFHLVGEG
jgi:hypothetical protein